MHDLIVKVIDDIRGGWRFRWWALGVAWVLCTLGWAYVWFLPDVYQANARVFVDTQSALRPLLRGLAIEPDVESNLNIVRQAMLSRPHLEQVARSTDLDLRATTPQAMDGLIESLRNRIVIEVDARTRSGTSDGLYRISFQDYSRTKSLEVVQSLLDSFVEDTLGSKRTGQEDAQRFLGDQIKEYEKRLSEAEERLSAFKREHVGMMPDSKGDYFARLQGEMSEVDGVRKSLDLAETRRAEMMRQLSGEEPFLFGFDNTTGATTDTKSSNDTSARIRDNERRLEELLLRFTDKHPEVIALRGTIEGLKKQQADELERLKRGQKGTGSLSQSLKANPIYQAIDVELKKTDVQIAELRQDLAQRQTRIAELRRMVDTVPEVEAQLARLNRDYDVTRGQYQQLVQRLETARLSEEADRTGVVKFDVLDPPSVPVEPEAPNRPLLLTGVLMLSLLAALALAYGLNLLRPVFQNVRSLADVTGLPVIGQVSRTVTAQHATTMRLNMLAFSGCAAALVVAFAVVMLLRGGGVA